MFEIYDGRSEFWQWDSDCMLIVNELPLGSQVHFSNKTYRKRLPVEIFEKDEKKVCHVPNILLQCSEPLEVYSYVIDESGRRTTHHTIIDVIASDKPVDYVYTETEVKHYREIAEDSTKQLKENNEQMAILTTTVNDKTDEILEAIEQAVFDKQLLKDILAGTCEELTGDSITSLGDYVFYGSSVVNVNLPNCISIGSSTFKNSDLTNLNVPMLTSVRSNTFEGCHNLTTFNQPLLETMGYKSLFDCRNMTSIDLPKLSSVGNDCFAYCLELIDINLPMLESCGQYAFKNCTKLTTVNLPLIKTIESYAFTTCYALKSVDIPNADTLGNYVFQNCNKLITSEYPKVTSIGTNVFDGCKSIEALEFPNIKTIGKNAFKNCTSLRKVWISSSCETISATTVSNSPFYNCTRTNFKIFCEATEKPSGWDTHWNRKSGSATCTVEWGATYEDYLAY